jgi:uncharacterized protein YjiS (DUF1127 family)
VSSLAHQFVAPRPRRADRRESVAARFWRMFEEWRRRTRSRTQLARLSERELRDIGLTPVDAAKESAKPFWLG